MTSQPQASHRNGHSVARRHQRSDRARPAVRALVTEFEKRSASCQRPATGSPRQRNSSSTRAGLPQRALSRNGRRTPPLPEANRPAPRGRMEKAAAGAESQVSPHASPPDNRHRLVRCGSADGTSGAGTICRPPYPPSHSAPVVPSTTTSATHSVPTNRAHVSVTAPAVPSTAPFSISATPAPPAPTTGAASSTPPGASRTASPIPARLMAVAPSSAPAPASAVPQCSKRIASPGPQARGVSPAPSAGACRSVSPAPCYARTASPVPANVRHLRQLYGG